MVLLGHICNGKIELDEPVPLPEGAKVRIELSPAEEARPDKQAETLGQVLMKFSGAIQDAPADLARQHDHYLHGIDDYS